MKRDSFQALRYDAKLGAYEDNRSVLDGSDNFRIENTRI
jgi:hypothetical protein